MSGLTFYFMQRLSFRGLYQGGKGQSRANPGFGRVLSLKEPCYIVNPGVMQSLHKNENLLSKDFQDFLVRSQQLPQKRIPFYLRRVSRFHEVCYFRSNLNRLAKRKQGALQQAGVPHRFNSLLP